MTNAPLTLEQAGDPVEVRNRIEEIADRHFCDFGSGQLVAMQEAIQHEVTGPLVDRIAELERQIKEIKEPRRLSRS